MKKKQEKRVCRVIWKIFKITGIIIVSIGGALVFLVVAGYGLLFFGQHLDEFIARREGGVKLHDPCFRSYYIEKGPIYRIEGNRVCMEFERGATTSYTKTLEGADAQTFHKIDFYYFADKNHVYYKDEILEGVNPADFKPLGKRTGYFTDGKNIYHNGERLETDVNNFHLPENNSGRHLCNE